MTRWFLFITLALAAPVASSAQTFTTPNPVLQRIWQEGITNSRIEAYAQALLDSVGPRLTGTPGHKRGNDWLVAVYNSLGITARNEQYGTWKGWRRGITHVDLLTPRVRSLEGMMLAWSPGTPGGRPVEADVVILPEFADSTQFVAWLPQARGKFVLVSMPQPSCRADLSWRQGTDSTSGVFQRFQQARTEATQRWNRRVQSTGYSLALGTGTLGKRLEAAEVAGVIASRWSNGWGVNQVFNSINERAPSIDLSCEDYGLVYRLAENGDQPRLRVTADAEFLGEVPVFNTIAELKGTSKPNEYVMLSAHFDSWDGGSGATDNGSGTLLMLEAMRILKQIYPNPKRTILVGHWGGEEQGLIGSRAFAKDHPEIITGLQALFNQDNGTGHVQTLGAAGLVKAGDYITRWHAALPQELSARIRLQIPGQPAGGGSDNASFACYGTPAFGLGAVGFDYSPYTWHTQRDTYDKLSFENLRHNATLTAMLVYLAAEEPELIPRDRAELSPGPNNQPRAWPTCSEPQRNSTNYFNPRR
jgi:carboxypeptidase Q